MGVYITNSKTSFLIDGLHTKYGEDYLFPDEKLIHKINTILKPRIILFTHQHGDHYNEEISKKFLQLNKESKLFGPKQITSNYADVDNEIITIKTEDYTKQTYQSESLKITGLKINHAGKRHLNIENVGYIINISNKNILHVGDTNWLEEINLFSQLDIQKESVDVAILPYWMLLDQDATELIQKYINPKQVIATHISPRITKEKLASLKKQFPKVYFLTEQEQQIKL